METVFDILTTSVFAGLVVLFLHRSIGTEPAGDSLWQYLGAATGCAVANYLGNNGYAIPGLVLLLATLMFIYYVLHPFGRPRQP